LKEAVLQTKSGGYWIARFRRDDTQTETIIRDVYLPLVLLHRSHLRWRWLRSGLIVLPSFSKLS
jgi:hypothetical protein